MNYPYPPPEPPPSTVYPPTRGAYGYAPRPTGGVFHHLGLMVTGGMVAAALLMGVGLWRSGSQFLEGIRIAFSQPQPEPQVDVRSLIIQQVRGASELTTAIFAMEAVVPTSRDRTIAGYTVGKTTLLYIAYGEVRAGIDLTQLQPQDVELLGDTLRLRLPPPQVLDSKIDVNRSQVYDYDRGLLGLGPDAATQLQEAAQRQALARIVSAACDRGILTEANRRAEAAVGQFLGIAGYRQFQIETQTPPAETCASSSPDPDPQLPNAGLEAPLPYPSSWPTESIQ